VFLQPLLVACGPGRLQGLDNRGGHALVEHAAQEFPAGGKPGRAVEHLDIGAEGPEDGSVARGAGSTGQHRDAQTAAGHRGHHRDVGERNACFAGEFGQLTFGARRGRVQVGPQNVRRRALVLAHALVLAQSGQLGRLGQPGQPGLERVHCSLCAVDAQHQVRSARRIGLAGGVDDRFGGGYRRIVAANTHPHGD
jgi:hypothetical protein